MPLLIYSGLTQLWTQVLMQLKRDLLYFLCKKSFFFCRKYFIVDLFWRDLHWTCPSTENTNSELRHKGKRKLVRLSLQKVSEVHGFHQRKLIRGLKARFRRNTTRLWEKNESNPYQTARGYIKNIINEKTNLWYCPSLFCALLFDKLKVFFGLIWLNYNECKFCFLFLTA